MSTELSVDERPVSPERGWPGCTSCSSRLLFVIVLTIGSLGCGGGGDLDPGGPKNIDASGDSGMSGDSGVSSEADAAGDAGGANLPYATGVVSFEAGEGAGYGQDNLPGVVLGPPNGAGGTSGSADVVALGKGGEIVVEFGERAIVDGEGADFIVFENSFYTEAHEDGIYQELGEVSVSADGEEWKTYECNHEPSESGRWPGCAGWRPVKDYDPTEVLPLEPALTGGDPFDLEDVGLEKARYVRIHGVSSEGWPPKVGFDLDAVGIVNVGR